MNRFQPFYSTSRRCIAGTSIVLALAIAGRAIQASTIEVVPVDGKPRHRWIRQVQRISSPQAS